MQQVVQAAVQLNITVRGLYGEGTEATGNLFQISNQTTLGDSEPTRNGTPAGGCSRLPRSR